MRPLRQHRTCQRFFRGAPALFGRVGLFLPALLGCFCWDAAARTGPATSLVTPVSPACVSSPFGPRHLATSPLPDAFHNGIDLPVPVGGTVRAVASGTVVRVQRKGPGGLELLIQHDGFVGVYSHLGLVAPAIAEGHRTVRGGQKIGTVGRSGLTFGSHLFFGMIMDHRFVDPAALLGLAPCQGSERRRASVAPDRDSPTPDAPPAPTSDLGR